MKMAIIINENKRIKDKNDKIKENQIKKIMNNIYYNITLIRNCITFTLILLIINMFCQIKSNILFNLFYFQNSSKITLKIKGIGESYIFGNGKIEDDVFNFTNINYLKEVSINGKKQDKIAYKFNFDQEDNIVELIWDDNIIDCSNMFWKCSSITEIDLSNFNTSRVESMYNMFRDCSSLTSLNLSNFNTSQVWNFHCMFFGCSSLTSLDLSSFDTSKVKFMLMMFYDCLLLTSLDLSNFDTSEVIQMENMFNGCTQLKYINLNNFDESQLTGFDNMFNNIPENAIICLKDIKAESKIISQINNGKKCYAIDCIDDSNSKQIKLNNNDNECNQLCDKSLQYLYEYNGRCYKNCVKGFLYDENNNKMNKCKCELDECLICPKEALDKGLCTKCNTNYYQKENDKLNKGEFIKCYKVQKDIIWIIIYINNVIILVNYAKYQEIAQTIIA